MDAEDFLDVAWDLVGGLREADWRSAVSRAYYAVFHVTSRLFQSCGFTVPQAEQAHAYLWLRLSNAGYPPVENCGTNLNHLRRIRNWCDDDLRRFITQLQATSQVQTASDIIQLLQSVETTPNIKSQITDAIKIYERDVLGVVTWHP